MILRAGPADINWVHFDCYYFPVTDTVEGGTKGADVFLEQYTAS